LKIKLPINKRVENNGILFIGNGFNDYITISDSILTIEDTLLNIITQNVKKTTEKQLKLISPEISNFGNIPKKYTCFGLNYSPELTIVCTIKETKSFALVCIDRSAENWVHWLIWNIPPNTTTIDENEKNPDFIEGLNSWGEIGYCGADPPKNTGTHEYKFILFAIDKKLDLKEGSDYKQFKKSIKGHVLAKSNLIGYFEYID